MVKSINVEANSTKFDGVYQKVHNHKTEITIPDIDASALCLKIEFLHDIAEFRTQDYRWKEIKKTVISNWYSSKILKLSNGQFVQANQYVGSWEVNPQHPRILFWHLRSKYLSPLAKYDMENNKRIDEGIFPPTKHPLALLFPIDIAIETSRSKYPFSAITCFTDHCDFDTLNNLKIQRQFFKKHNISITKGFFLNHFSKRDGTACAEYHAEEFKKWLADGHELAYHSLTQSIKPVEESISDFRGFKPVFDNTSVWIDHGFQPYNVSRFHNYHPLKDEYSEKLYHNKVQILWNYVDTGTCVKGIINQINPVQFTLGTLYKGIKNLKFKSRMRLMVKTIIFHYLENNDSLKLYGKIAKKIKRGNSINAAKFKKSELLNIFKLFHLLLPIFLFWKIKKNKVYPLAKFTPLIFHSFLDGKVFTFFQTIEMTDFKNGLCSENIDLLIKERGVFIAHTYFSAPMSYHGGKLFKNELEIDSQVDENFKYLSEKISSKEIWNPTISELVSHLNQLEMVLYDCDENGNLTIKSPEDLPFRKLN